MMENTRGITEHKIDEVFVGFVLVKRVVKGIARNSNPYLTMVFGDRSGEIETKIWNNVDSVLEKYPVEAIVKIQGRISEFRSKKQIEIEQIRHVNDSDNITLEDVLESAPLDGESLLWRLRSTVHSRIDNEKIKAITMAILDKYENQIKTFPAAKMNHHAYLGGLAYHTVSMLDMASDICIRYPFLNKDLLFAGVILHDIAKVHEYTGPVGTDYTFEGKMIGHIPMISEEIGITAKELGLEGEEVTLLRHLVLSHHGKREWGSPTLPAIPEAEVLHLIDMLDAKMDTLNKALKNTEPGQFTERLFSMGNREYYKSTLE